jgi:hypothetical protein
LKKTYHGGCHCGAVRFQTDIDLSAGTSKCNCSMCAKGRFWKAVVKADDFRLLEGRGALSEYQFGARNIHHMFCATCGVKLFGRGHMPPLGEFYAVNLACLEDATDAELAQAPVQYEDGRGNEWQNSPRETRHL